MVILQAWLRIRTRDYREQIQPAVKEGLKLVASLRITSPALFKKLKNDRNMTRKPRSDVRILIYQTWAIKRERNFTVAARILQFVVFLYRLTLLFFKRQLN